MACLVGGESPQVSLAEFAKLDDYQIAEILLHKRDKDGRVVFPDAEETPYEQIFRTVWQQRGMNEQAIEAKWQEYLKQTATGD